MEVVRQQRQHTELDCRGKQKDLPKTERGAAWENDEGWGARSQATRQPLGEPLGRGASVEPKLHRARGMPGISCAGPQVFERGERRRARAIDPWHGDAADRAAGEARAREAEGTQR